MVRVSLPCRAYYHGDSFFIPDVSVSLPHQSKCISDGSIELPRRWGYSAPRDARHKSDFKLVLGTLNRPSFVRIRGCIACRAPMSEGRGREYSGEASAHKDAKACKNIFFPRIIAASTRSRWGDNAPAVSSHAVRRRKLVKHLNTEA